MSPFFKRHFVIIAAVVSLFVSLVAPLPARASQETGGGSAPEKVNLQNFGNGIVSGECPGTTGNAECRQIISGVDGCISSGTSYTRRYECVVRVCGSMTSTLFSRQTVDACYKRGMGMASCNPNSSTGYAPCMGRMRDLCNRVLFYMTADNSSSTSSAVSGCQRAAAYYGSGYAGRLDIPHGTAYSDRLSFFTDPNAKINGSNQVVSGGESTGRAENGTDVSSGLNAIIDAAGLDAGCIGGNGNECQAQNIAETKLYRNWIKPGVRAVLLGVGILAIFMLVISGIQYAAAQDNASSVAAAKGRIINIVIGLLLYLIMFSFLQMLVPGGIFNVGS